MGEATFHCRYNYCHLMVKNEMTTTKFTMLSTDTSSEVAPVNFIDHLQNFKKKMNKGFAVDVGKKNKIKNNNKKKAQYQHTHTHKATNRCSTLEAKQLRMFHLM